MLQQIHVQFQDAIKVQISSTKILMFLVNDILDFAQIKANKFRKECINFNIKVGIEEIISILQYKADQNGVLISNEYLNFPTEFNYALGDYLVCTDI